MTEGIFFGLTLIWGSVWGAIGGSTHTGGGVFSRLGRIPESAPDPRIRPGSLNPPRIPESALDPRIRPGSPNPPRIPVSAPDSRVRPGFPCPPRIPVSALCIGSIGGSTPTGGVSSSWGRSPCPPYERFGFSLTYLRVFIN